MKIRGGVWVCGALLSVLGCASQRVQETPSPGWGYRGGMDAKRGSHGAAWSERREQDAAFQRGHDSEGLDVMPGIEDSSALRAFAGALERTGMGEELEEVEEFTVLAPTDFAFQQMSTEKRADLFGPEGNDQLRDLVRRHIVVGKYDSADLVNAGELTTMAGTRVDVRNVAGLPLPGGAQVLSSTETKNGFVHQIDRVLSP